MTTETTADPAAQAHRPEKASLRKPPRRKPVKRATTWLHRWLSLVLGLVLVVECTTGSLLVYGPEIERQLRSDLYVAKGDPQGPVSYTHLTLPTNREV